MYLIIMNVIISDYVRNFANAPTSPIDGEAMRHLLQAKLWFLKCSLFCECAINQLRIEKAHSNRTMRHSFIWCAWRGPNLITA